MTINNSNVSISDIQGPWNICDIPSTLQSFELIEESEAIYLQEFNRYILLSTFSILVFASVIANIATLYAAHTRRNHVTYKFCLTSLSLSDLTAAIFSGIPNITNLSTKVMDWLSGEEMCLLTPFVQTFSTIASSLTLTCVALDRYQAVTSISPGSRWQPSQLQCIIIVTFLWVISCCVAIPMYASYSWVQVWVYQEDSNGNYDNCYTMHRCVTETQGFIGIYYIIAFSVIFSPVILIFLVIHGVIAKFIWLRRKPYIPPTDNSASKNNNNCDNSISSPSLNMTKRTQLTTVSAESNSENNKIKVTPTPAIKYVNQRNYRSVHRERNVRTFRRIVLMMLAFFALRSPNWISMVFFTNRTLHGEGYWITKYVFSLLNVLCCTLNPLMYCFSDETLLVLRKICGWMRCPTCASWFRERRKRLNTSTVVERKATCDKDTGPVIVHVPRMVPRGPYSDSEKQTVKEPAPVLQTNIQTKEICPTEDNLCNNHDISESSSQINIKVQE